MSHTEAPWIRKDTETYAEIIVGDQVVAMVARADDADLIAASPVMIAEMEKLAKSVEDTGFELPQSFYDAIAQARGRA